MQQTEPHNIVPSTSNAEVMATVNGRLAYVSLSVPQILLEAGQGAADVPADTPIRTFVAVKA